MLVWRNQSCNQSITYFLTLSVENFIKSKISKFYSNLTKAFKAAKKTLFGFHEGIVRLVLEWFFWPENSITNENHSTIVHGFLSLIFIIVYFTVIGIAIVPYQSITHVHSYNDRHTSKNKHIFSKQQSLNTTKSQKQWFEKN